MMSDDGGAFAAPAGPIAACRVTASGREMPEGFRTGQDVVLVWRGSTPVDRTAVFIERGFDVYVHLRAMQRIHIARNQDTIGVVPWPFADAISCAYAVRDLEGPPVAAVHNHPCAEVCRPTTLLSRPPLQARYNARPRPPGHPGCLHRPVRHW